VGASDPHDILLPAGQALQISTDDSPVRYRERQPLPVALALHLDAQWSDRWHLVHSMQVQWDDALDPALRADAEDQLAVSMGTIAGRLRLTVLHMSEPHWDLGRTDGGVDLDSGEPTREWNPHRDKAPHDRDGWVPRCRMQATAVRWAQGPMRC
jgi:hypothetical protein